MTRQNKVALVVGFALVLFVGILISDYFSAAQTRKTADLVPTDLAAVTADGSAPLIDLQDADRPIQPDPANPNPAALPETAAAPTVQEPPRPPVELGGGPAPAPARFHDVRPGESLSLICHLYYGDVALIDELADLNGIDDPDTVQAGHRLRVPPANLLRDGSASSWNEPAAQPAAEARRDAPPYARYRVRPGDSLSGIAERFLSSPGRWRQLYELNRDVIGDPHEIHAGTVIRVPAPPAG
jgi:nucleoid-associated protein YgaU